MTAVDPDDANSKNPEDDGNVQRPEAVIVPVGPGDISENLLPGTSPLTRFEGEANRLRRWVIGGLGGLILIVLLAGPIIVLIRPELIQFATTYIQVALSGFFGIAGSVVGFLFARGRE